jgi:catechol 2,3-dioxygenase-like lactoylglutathione lyase family enzyme
MMMTRANTVGMYVSDQDRALDFYVDALGFEKLVDEPIGPEGRWIEVAPAGAQTHLVLFTPPGQEDRIGTFSNVVFVRRHKGHPRGAAGSWCGVFGRAHRAAVGIVGAV